jgi:polysaccharide biosynthesis/export protein
LQKFLNPVPRYSRIIIALAIITFCSGCVSRKKTVLFQDAHTSTYINDTTSVKTDSFLNYIKIQPFDVLDIRVVSTLEAIKNLTESRALVPGNSTAAGYYSGYFVSDRGTVNLPQVGEVRVAGLTLPETVEVIRKEMTHFLKEPFVEVKFLTFKVTMLGEVNSQGIITVANEKATLSDALALAGGVSDFGTVTGVKIIRGNPNAPIVYELDLTSLNSMKASGFKLLPNDIIYIPPRRGKYISGNLSVALTVLGALNTLGLVYSLFRPRN